MDRKSQQEILRIIGLAIFGFLRKEHRLYDGKVSKSIQDEDSFFVLVIRVFMKRVLFEISVLVRINCYFH